MSESRETWLVVGAGLAGTLMSIFLARSGRRVLVYEKRPDPRGGAVDAGRSINLALSTRGLAALAAVGLADDVLAHAVPMRGRMVHNEQGETSFQPYGKDETEVINSVSRAGLNLTLLRALSHEPNVELHFEQRCVDIDLAAPAAEFEHTRSGERIRVTADVVMGADGAFSAVRTRLQREDRFSYHQEYLEHGYKELTIPPSPGGGFAMERNALHIWPRGTYMMIALPNEDGSYTCTCFWPFAAFEQLHTAADVSAFFRQHFPDGANLMPDLERDYFANPTSSLVTIRCGRWYHGDKILILGDASHAVVPFYGQGMNAAFEDCLELNDCLASHPRNRQAAFEEFYRRRKRHADALATLAVDNFVEMRDHVSSPAFIWKKRLEIVLQKLIPRYKSLYAMVSFSRTGYADAVAIHNRQKRQMRGILIGAGMAVVAGILGLLWWVTR